MMLRLELQFPSNQSASIGRKFLQNGNLVGGKLCLPTCNTSRLLRILRKAHE